MKKLPLLMSLCFLLACSDVDDPPFAPAIVPGLPTVGESVDESPFAAGGAGGAGTAGVGGNAGAGGSSTDEAQRVAITLHLDSLEPVWLASDGDVLDDQARAADIALFFRNPDPAGVVPFQERLVALDNRSLPTTESSKFARRFWFYDFVDLGLRVRSTLGDYSVDCDLLFSADGTVEGRHWSPFAVSWRDSCESPREVVCVDEYTPDSDVSGMPALRLAFRVCPTRQ